MQVITNKLAAVVRPFTLNPSLKIVPAPKKPIPDNNCAGIPPDNSDIFSPHITVSTALIPTNT